MTDMTKNEIDEKIAKLQAQKAEIEKKEREQAEVERKKREEEKGKELTTIKNAIRVFNEKHNEHYSLAKSIEIKDEIFSDYFPFGKVIKYVDCN